MIKSELIKQNRELKKLLKLASKKEPSVNVTASNLTPEQMERLQKFMKAIIAIAEIMDA